MRISVKYLESLNTYEIKLYLFEYVNALEELVMKGL